MTSSISGLFAWERDSFIARSDDGLPKWLVDLRTKHLAAISEYHAAIASVVDTGERIEAENRAHRRAVRDAIAAGKQPPAPKSDAIVGEAQVDVAQEDSLFARRELAEVSMTVLAELRQRRDEFAPYYLGGSPELRYALGAGPDGMTEDVRQRRAAQAAIASEPAMVDLSLAEHDRYTHLDEKGAASAA